MFGWVSFLGVVATTLITCITCEICFQSFFDRRSLTEHIRTHTGEKRYKCEVCSRSFARKATLTRHLQDHAGSL